MSIKQGGLASDEAQMKQANIDSRLQTVLNQVSQKYRLTRRENHVVGLLVRGLSNKEIANSLSISPNSVKALLRLIMLKMRTTSRSSLVAEVLLIAVSDDEKRD